MIEPSIARTIHIMYILYLIGELVKIHVVTVTNVLYKAEFYKCIDGLVKLAIKQTFHPAKINYQKNRNFDSRHSKHLAISFIERM